MYTFPYGLIDRGFNAATFEHIVKDVNRVIYSLLLFASFVVVRKSFFLVSIELVRVNRLAVMRVLSKEEVVSVGAALQGQLVSLRLRDYLKLHIVFRI